MAKIESLLLRCCDPDAQRRFYCDVLGMQLLAGGSVGYGGMEAQINFLKAEQSYMPKGNDLYWKIALAVPDIELACNQLTKNGVQVGEPRQFQEVGYLAHFTDPEGFTIELIEHWFQGNRPDRSLDSALLGGGAHFNLITLRAADIEPVLVYCLQCGLKLLCVQPVESHGFTLYFFAFTEDNPPSPDLHAIENREWLYQRNYTVLEIQHATGAEAMTQALDQQAGYAGTLVSGLTAGFEHTGLLIKPSQS